MNRFLLGGCLMVMFGCGARSDYFTDQDGFGGPQPGAAGTPAAAGALNIAGAPQFAGAPGVGAGPSVGGAPGVGAGPNVGGAPGVAGAIHHAGTPGIAGGLNVGGTPGAGGAIHHAGGPGVAGWPNVGGAPGTGGTTHRAGAPGVAGSGATPGVIEACQVIAGNSCEQCLCKTCSSQIVQCFSNLGCAVILACAQQTGCQGIDCYKPKNCRAVIDQFGGVTGKAMSNVLSLVSCSAGSQNSCSCN